MKFKLEVKKKHSWIWLKGVTGAKIDCCCYKCFRCISFNEVHKQTQGKEYAFVTLDIMPDERIKAYYFCGIKGNRVLNEENTHVVFVPDEGKNIVISNDNIHLEVTDAHEVNFQDYKPNPVGNFDEYQRRCRIWNFINYLLDGMPL